MNRFNGLNASDRAPWQRFSVWNSSSQHNFLCRSCFWRYYSREKYSNCCGPNSNHGKASYWKFIGSGMISFGTGLGEATIFSLTSFHGELILSALTAWTVWWLVWWGNRILQRYLTLTKTGAKKLNSHTSGFYLWFKPCIFCFWFLRPGTAFYRVFGSFFSLCLSAE